MTISSVETVFSALNDAGARYLVVGGFAVFAHGHLRVTNDLDLVLDLRSDRLEVTLGALAELGFRPVAPVSLIDFAQAEIRSGWKRERGLVVLGLVSDRYLDIVIDVFAEEPFPFAEEYAAAVQYELRPDLIVPVVSLSRLIAMKKAVGRLQDRIDVEALTKMNESDDV